MSLIEISQLEFVFRVALGAQYSKTLLVPEGRLLKYAFFSRTAISSITVTQQKGDRKISRRDDNDRFYAVYSQRRRKIIVRLLKYSTFRCSPRPCVL